MAHATASLKMTQMMAVQSFGHFIDKAVVQAFDDEVCTTASVCKSSSTLDLCDLCSDSGESEGRPMQGSADYEGDAGESDDEDLAALRYCITARQLALGSLGDRVGAAAGAHSFESDSDEDEEAAQRMGLAARRFAMGGGNDQPAWPEQDDGEVRSFLCLAANFVPIGTKDDQDNDDLEDQEYSIGMGHAVHPVALTMRLLALKRSQQYEDCAERGAAVVEQSVDEEEEEEDSDDEEAAQRFALAARKFARNVR
eukprot:CAMPEP_0203866328 /NCGR_PEP_ID=MMETSP0359-20131031/15883_1 /ASSEMBLY_ACC=CAM_ASM_000338 /TAXON_ID=268821 /ORGANISM="Scrippsiella Hangoei, Strain SHTV-5" /LENGTH=253 /DNA_ID=CAMNT_0050784401 /DNA_START=42 /DNA_END=803 /DNA_ORIENTATION=+